MKCFGSLIFKALALHGCSISNKEVIMHSKTLLSIKLNIHIVTIIFLNISSTCIVYLNDPKFFLR